MTTSLFGLGLRTQHYQNVLTDKPKIGWFEVISENFIGVGGRPRRVLHQVRADYPVALHGVGLSIGSCDLPRASYLQGLKTLAAELEPSYVSDHLCWTRHGGHNSHDLLPLPYNAATLAHVCERVTLVQEALQRRLYLENPSAYVAFASSDLSEAEFLRELCQRTGCGILLDVNNLYVNAMNLGVDAKSYLNSLRAEDLAYMHLAGHSVLDQVRIDTHDAPVCEAVWDLYEHAAALFPRVPTMIEWDGEGPEFAALSAELDRAKIRHAAGERRAVLETPRSKPGLKAKPAADSWPKVAAEFWQLATGGRSVTDGLSSAEDAATLAPGLLQPGLPSPVLVGINVYADAYILRLHEVLCEMYPTLTYIMGQGRMKGLTRAYLHRHRPYAESVKYVAEALPRYLREESLDDDFGVPQEALADIAAFEWAQADVLDAPNAPEAPVTPEALALITPEEWPEVTVTFSSALRLLATRFAVAPVLAAVAAGETPAKPEATGKHYIVYRRGEDCEYLELSTTAALVMKELHSGSSFYPACLAAAQELNLEEEAVVHEAVTALGVWISLEQVQAIATDQRARSHDADPPRSLYS